MNFKDIEEHVRQKWDKEHIFEGIPDDREKFFITPAFPYPNSPQHIGHARTYTITDIYARFKRMEGLNVLYPMAFHVTGTPILAMAERIKEGDEELLNIFENIYGIPREKAKTLTKPEELVMYFSKEIEEGMKKIGFAIDWTRKFYTFDAHFNKFIEWQFKKLKEKGLLVKGEHPVPWSLKLNSAVGAHDTKGDVDPELEEITAIKFAYEDGYVLTATYRPETIFGVTNIWVNPNSKIAKVKHNNEIYYITEEAFNALKHQIELELLDVFDAKKMLNKNVKNLMTGEEVPVYPAEFVKADEGTGIVMSVPAHAPFDYVALRDLGINRVIKIIEVPGMDIPAKDIVERMGIKNQFDKRLEEATKEVYKREFREGKLIVYKPMPVSKAKEVVREDMINEGKAISIWIIANSPVYTRAGDKVIVKKVKNQWFIDYGNKEWKEKTREWINKMRIIPDEARSQLLSTLDWLDKKACTRARGLGTKFPFDKSQVIESLSDSTIYMAFYTIAHKVKEFPPEQLTEEFFDYIFLGKGKPVNEKHKSLREEFLYWYPLDSRHSGADLLRNHLVFFVMNHIAIFPPELWPKQIVVNGFVLMDGKKMSKSLGNILPLKKAIEEYGADVIRFSVVSGAELMQDTDFNKSVATGIASRLEFFYNEVMNAKGGSEKIDRWLESKFNSKLKLLRQWFENFELRKIALEFFYEFYNELQWYKERGGKGNKEVMEKWLLVMAPFMPFITEYLWEKLGHNESIALNRLPDAGDVDEELLKAEDAVMQIVADAERIKELMKRKGKEGKRLIVFIPENWKFELFDELSEMKEHGEIMKHVKEKYKDKLGEVMQILKKLGNKIYSIEKPVKRDYLINYIREAIPFLEEKLGLKVEISDETKAKLSLPSKIAVMID